MGKLPTVRVSVLLLVVMGVTLFLAGCGDGNTPQVSNSVTLSYSPPFVPVTFSLDSNGHISFSASARIVTEIGEFAIAAGSAITAFAVPNDSLLLTVRHKQDGNLVDSVYAISVGQGVGNADVKGSINEVKIGWDGKSNSVFIDASNGDITSIVVQGSATTYTTPVPVAPTTVVPTATPIPPPTPTPVPAFQCPSVGTVSSWMNTSTNKIGEYCAFHAGDIQGQTLTSVICTTQDGGTTIEYTPVSQPNVLVVQACDGGKLPEIYGFTIRFIKAYPSSGKYSANVCAIAAQAPAYLPSGWRVQAQANC